MKSAKPTVFTTSNEDGRDRVQRSDGKYAFFMESTSIEYYMQKYCDLKMIGKLDSKDYGIAMPKSLYHFIIFFASTYLFVILNFRFFSFLVWFHIANS